MKRLILTISICSSLITVFNVHAQENGKWEILNEGGSYRTIDFINDQVGWIAGDKEVVGCEVGLEV